MSSWAIEAHDTTGRTFVFRPAVTSQEIEPMVAELLTYDSTGGIVIYRSIVATDNRGGGGNGDEGEEEAGTGVERSLGLVADGPPCTYCHVRGGHNGDCWVNS